MDKRFHYFIVGTLAVSILLLAIFNMMTLAEKNPLEYTNDPFPTQEQVEISDHISFQVSYCLNSKNDIKSDFTLFLIPLENELSPIATGGDSVTHLSGCHDIQSVSQQIPLSTPEGKYFFRYNVFTPGRFRNHRQVVETLPFEVIAADDVPNELPAGRLTPINPRTNNPVFVRPAPNGGGTSLQVILPPQSENPQSTPESTPRSQPTAQPTPPQQSQPTPEPEPEPTPAPTPVRDLIDRVIDSLPTLPQLPI